VPASPVDSVKAPVAPSAPPHLAPPPAVGASAVAVTSPEDVELDAPPAFAPPEPASSGESSDTNMKMIAAFFTGVLVDRLISGLF
jgi:hypothetical protein